MIAPTRIAVTTPTGNVGRHVVRALLRAGTTPVVLVRDPSRLEADVRPLVEAREVDQADVAAVVEATRDVDTLFWVDPAPADHPDPLASYAAMTESVRGAVLANDLDRVVFQSSVGAEQRHGLGEIDGLAATEVALEAVATHVVHLRCGYFFSNLLIDPSAMTERGELATAMPVDVPLPWVDPRDVAEVAAGWLLGTQWVGHHVQAVYGPEDLSFEQVASVLTEVLRCEVRAVHLSEQDLGAALLDAGLTPARVEALVGMSRVVRRDTRPALPRDATATTPSRLAGWVWDHLRPLV